MSDAMSMKFGDLLKLKSFLIESNAIEGIHESPTAGQLAFAEAFLDLNEITVRDMEDAVRQFQPNARLREFDGLDVRVGNYYPPPGSPKIRVALEGILAMAQHADPYKLHHQYESLHPFTDGNGRSGRLLWLWRMNRTTGDPFSLGFLHRWYYQSLSHGR